MPESKGRKKASDDRRKRRKATEEIPPAALRSDPGSPRWWAPTMVTLLVIGLVWIVVFYITQQSYPVPGIGLWNLGIGFGIAMVGFGMTTRWRNGS